LCIGKGLRYFHIPEGDLSNMEAGYGWIWLDFTRIQLLI